MQKLKPWLKNPYNVLYIVFAYHIVFAFIVDTPYEIFHGLIAISLSYDLLISDYVYKGGVGGINVREEGHSGSSTDIADVSPIVRTDANVVDKRVYINPEVVAMERRARSEDTTLGRFFEEYERDG